MNEFFWDLKGLGCEIGEPVAIDKSPRSTEKLVVDGELVYYWHIEYQFSYPVPSLSDIEMQRVKNRIYEEYRRFQAVAVRVPVIRFKNIVLNKGSWEA